MCTIFEFNNQRVCFITSDKLERYTKVVEWDNGYLVMAKYKKMPVPKFNLRDWHFLIIQLQLISWPRTTLTTAVPDAKYTTNQTNSYIPVRIILQ